MTPLLIDIRWHLASLVGVFLALGLGMLIGAQLAGAGTLEAEQQRLAERLEASFMVLRTENRSLRDELAGVRSELAEEQEFADLLLSAVAAATLAGVEVELYTPPGQEEWAARVERVLAQAGAAPQLRVGVPAGSQAAGDALVVVASAPPPGGTPLEQEVPVPGEGAPALALSGDLPSGGRPEGHRLVVAAAVRSPRDLLALLETIRSGEAPADPVAALMERLGR